MSAFSSEGGLRPSAPTTVPLEVAVGTVWEHPDGRFLIELQGRALERLDLIRDWKTIAAGGS